MLLAGELECRADAIFFASSYSTSYATVYITLVASVRPLLRALGTLYSSHCRPSGAIFPEKTALLFGTRFTLAATIEQPLLPLPRLWLLLLSHRFV